MAFYSILGSKLDFLKKLDNLLCKFINENFRRHFSAFWGQN